MLCASLAIADIANCGTIITSGSGIIAVVATGFSTESGHINVPVPRKRKQAPMQRPNDRLGTRLAGVSAAAVAVCDLGWLHGMRTLARNIGILTCDVMQVTDGAIELQDIAITDRRSWTITGQIASADNTVLMQLFRVVLQCNGAEYPQLSDYSDG